MGRKRWRFLLGVIPLVLAFSEDKTDAIGDRLRYEIAAAQRDYVMARQQLDRVQAQLLAKTGQAEKICAAEQKVFNLETFTCGIPEKK